MGLDVTLGILVLIGGIRGFTRGFAAQAIRLGALIGCVFLADPIRDLARPAARSYLPGLAPELLDRLLWWTSAALAYVVTAGLATSILKAARKRPIGEPEPNRTDQGAGFALGAAKAALASCFLLAGIGKYGPDYAPRVGAWAVEQLKTSQALVYSERFKPADRVWASVPVQRFLTQVRTRGLGADAEPKDAVAEHAPDRTRSLALPGGEVADRIHQLNQDLQRIESALPGRDEPDKSR